jgi:glycosyltransferase involved in cell wall biosynthesis
MAFGKPTLCFIKPSLIKTYPADFPIINAKPDNLVEVLASLLENGTLRNQIGRQSRAYVAKYHDSHKIAQDLVKIYQKMNGKNNKEKYERL